MRDIENDRNNRTEGNIDAETPIVRVRNATGILLKQPENLAGALVEDKDSLALGVVFMAVAAVFHAVFGLALGLFGGWETGIMACVKAPMIAVGAMAVCFPSLYVFGCVGGIPLSVKQTFMLAGACLAMVGLLLVGLAPVMWLFAVSTRNIGFIALLGAVLWAIALLFAMRLIGKLEKHDFLQQSTGIRAWFLVLVLVSLQMTTCMRPLMASSDRGWWTSEKQFFLQHFASCFDTKHDKR